MPNQFGLETPQEAQARIAQGFALQRDRFQNSAMAANKPWAAGQALGSIFGPALRKTLDTRAARRDESTRLQEDLGISVQEARMLAKDSVPRDFAAVRQAKTMQKAGTAATAQYNELLGTGMNERRAMAASMITMSATLRKLGFPEEATNQTIQANALIQAEDDRDLKIQQVKGEISNTASTEAHRGITEFTDLSNYRERLVAEKENTDDPHEIDRLNREIERHDGRLSILTTRSLSDADERALGVGASDKIQLEILDGQLLDSKFEMLEGIVNDLSGTWATTKVGALGAYAATRLEAWMGVDPGTFGAEDLISDVGKYKSMPSYVSSQLRHDLTGAAMSAQEQPLMEPFLPSPGDSPSTMLYKIRAVRAYTQLDIRTRQEFANAYRQSDAGQAGNNFPSISQVPASLVATMQGYQKAAEMEQKLKDNQDAGVATPLDTKVSTSIDASNRYLSTRGKD